MAHYIKYEIFLPVEYIDKQTGEKRYLEYSSLRQLSSEVVERYGGYTETNPTMAPLYRGYYASGGEIEVDLLITSMVLVPASQFEESLIYFTQWKQRLEEKYNQEVILITYHPIQVIGHLS